MYFLKNAFISDGKADEKQAYFRSSLSWRADTVLYLQLQELVCPKPRSESCREPTIARGLPVHPVETLCQLQSGWAQSQHKPAYNPTDDNPPYKYPLHNG